MVSIRKVEMEIDWKVALNLKLPLLKTQPIYIEDLCIKFISKEETLNTELYIYSKYLEDTYCYLQSICKMQHEDR